MVREEYESHFTYYGQRPARAGSASTDQRFVATWGRIYRGPQVGNIYVASVYLPYRGTDGLIISAAYTRLAHDIQHY
jgi:hypothetical protein